jgi:hypothetical protein
VELKQKEMKKGKMMITISVYMLNLMSENCFYFLDNNTIKISKVISLKGSLNLNSKEWSGHENFRFLRKVDTKLSMKREK